MYELQHRICSTSLYHSIQFCYRWQTTWSVAL